MKRMDLKLMKERKIVRYLPNNNTKTVKLHKLQFQSPKNY